MKQPKLVRKGFWLTSKQAKLVEKKRKTFGSDSAFIRALIDTQDLNFKENKLWSK